MKSFPINKDRLIDLPYINYIFEQTPYSYKFKNYYFDNEVAFGLTRIEFGLMLAFVLITYLNYIVNVKNY